MMITIIIIQAYFQNQCYCRIIAFESLFFFSFSFPFFSLFFGRCVLTSRCQSVAIEPPPRGADRGYSPCWDGPLRVGKPRVEEEWIDGWKGVVKVGSTVPQERGRVGGVPGTDLSDH